MDTSNLSKELISDPRSWRLSIEISDKTLEMLTCSLSDHDILIYKNIPLDDTSSTPLSALGEAVYDNTLLLSDFSHTDVLIDTPRFIIVPSELSSDEMKKMIISSIWPTENLTILSHPAACTTDTLLCGVDTKLISFVRRTFPGCTVNHRLTPLLSYFTGKQNETAAPTIYVNIRNKRIDVMCFGEKGLQAMNTFSTPALEDALYYIFAVAKGCNIDTDNDEILICGAPSEAIALQSFIKDYITNVMILDLPEMVKTKKDLAPEAPLELTLLPSCE